MKNLILPLLFCLFLFSSCDKELDEGPKRTTEWVTLSNSTGAVGCSGVSEEVTFIVSHRDLSVSVDITPGNISLINVSVADSESINVIVQKTSDHTVLANADVKVRTESRPENLAEENRRVNYCDTFDLVFNNF